MALREELAAKIVNLFLPRVTDALPYDQLARWQKEKWLVLADECIRQMEWAVSSATIKNIPNTVPPGTIRAEWNRSLAPEDWKP